MALFGGKKPIEEEVLKEEEISPGAPETAKVVSLEDLYEKLGSIGKEISELKEMSIRGEEERKQMSEIFDDFLKAEEGEEEPEDKEAVPADETISEMAEEEAPGEEEGDSILDKILEAEPAFEEAYSKEGAREKLNAIDEEEKQQLSELLEKDPPQAAKFIMEILNREEKEKKEEAPMDEIPQMMGTPDGFEDEKKRELYATFGF